MDKQNIILLIISKREAFFMDFEKALQIVRDLHPNDLIRSGFVFQGDYFFSFLLVNDFTKTISLLAWQL